ncbi:MAG: rhodanese-like domain-containing protein, partial [Thermoguttaceae bacterium]
MLSLVSKHFLVDGNKNCGTVDKSEKIKQIRNIGAFVMLKKISPQEFNKLIQSGAIVDLIDVRTPLEFSGEHLSVAKNIPLHKVNLGAVADVRKGTVEPVYFMCQNEQRSSQACASLIASGFTNVVQIEGGMQAWQAAGLPVEHGKKVISLERQVRIGAGSLVLLGIILSLLVHPAFMLLSAFVGAGLIFAGVTDTCGMGLILARMPWNQINSETAGAASTSCSAATSASSCKPASASSCCAPKGDSPFHPGTVTFNKTSGNVRLKQYFLESISQFSYMITDEKTKTAIIVDPQRDVFQYIMDAKAGGYTIRHVLLTHFHADFVAGNIELQNATHADVYLSANANVDYAAKPLADNKEIIIGDLKLVTWEMPGHTPEGVAFLLYDLSKESGNPFAVLTGDTLFIDDVGRPDLLTRVGITSEELADLLFDSLARLKTLPDDTLVYPAHGAGSLCGKNLSMTTVSTIGEQKKNNTPFKTTDRAEFIKNVTEDLPDVPRYFYHDVVYNSTNREDLNNVIKRSFKFLSFDDVIALMKDGAQLVDGREPEIFDALHIKGAINVCLDGKFESWCGTVLDPKKPIIA